MSRANTFADESFRSYDTGVAGGIIAQKAFQDAFVPGASKSRITAVSSNVVAILQGGAFFGALSSPYFSSMFCPWT